MIAAARCAHSAPRRSGPRRVGKRKLPQRVSCNGPIIGCLVTALGLPTVAHPTAAQERELRSYGAGAPEAKLMLFYSSSIAFSPVGVPWGATGLSAMSVSVGRAIPRTELAIEVSYIPRLSADQRTVGFDKPEATNLAPVFPRPRLGIRLPWRLGLEGSWIPPFRLFDVTANVLGGGVARVRRRVRCPPNAASFRSHGARRRADHLQPGRRQPRRPIAHDVLHVRLPRQ